MKACADYAQDYDPDRDFDRWYTILAARRIAPLLAPGARILELGSATGAMTSLLAGQDRQITCIERSAAYVAHARARGLAGVTVRHAAIGDPLEGEGRFDAILATNLFHEVPDVTETLRRLLPALASHGRLHITLPNPASLHRIAAVANGLLSGLCELSDRGRRLHTLRLLYPADIVRCLADLGMREIRREGILVKPLPNAAMAALSAPMIEAWDALAHELPDHAAMTWFVFVRHAAT